MFKMIRLTRLMQLNCLRRSLDYHNFKRANLILNGNLFTLLGRECSSNSLFVNGLMIKLNPIKIRTYSTDENKKKKDDDSKKQAADELKPEDRIKKFKEEINKLESQISDLKGKTATKEGKSIKIEDGKYDKQSDDEEEIVYRLAYDFPGFKSKNIKVSVIDRILRIYAFQTSTKKDKDTKEYIYENTTEEILPKEVDSNKMSAKFDAENGFLIVEAILPENCDLKTIQKQTSELNDKLFKLEKELETKKKEMSAIKM